MAHRPRAGHPGRWPAASMTTTSEGKPTLMRAGGSGHFPHADRQRREGQAAVRQAPGRASQVRSRLAPADSAAFLAPPRASARAATASTASTRARRPPPSSGRSAPGGRTYWDAQWRYRAAAGESWRLKKRRLGLAWQEPDGNGGWRKRKGRCPDGWLDERAANVAAVAAMEEHGGELIDGERRAVRRPSAKSRSVSWGTSGCPGLKRSRARNRRQSPTTAGCYANRVRRTGVARASVTGGS